MSDGPDPAAIMAAVDIFSKNRLALAQLGELSVEQLKEEMSMVTISCANCKGDARDVTRLDESDDIGVYLLILSRSYVEDHFCPKAV